MPEKVVFLFGAGAEVPYGLPNGGEFALEIFRLIGEEDKASLKTEIGKINRTSHQAAWFPKDYTNNRIHVFGKTSFESIISSTLEMKRDIIINTLLHFDDMANKVKIEFSDINIDIDDVLEKLGCRPGSVQYGSVLVLNEQLSSADTSTFFGSDYFSALAQLIKDKKFTEDRYEDASTLARSFIEILVGALGKNLVHSLNNKLFSSAPDDLPFLDDIGGIFNVDYKRVGLDALTFILNKQPFSKRRDNITPDSQKQHIAIEFYLRIAECIYSNFADYQSLVDSHYRYLYQPAKEWAKFCKIATFLFAVHRYVNSYLQQVSSTNGYYEDIASCSNIDVVAIGTTNYTSLVMRTNTENIFFLNGSLDAYYDPYRNEIGRKDDDKFQVPFLFTQSGIKPMTSIKMSRKYIDFYEKCQSAERFVVLGYGFNSDDGHINTLIRSLADSHPGKMIDVVAYKESNTAYRKAQIEKNIRCDSRNAVRVHALDAERKINGRHWLEALFPAEEE